jgi:hypothetical protein
MRSVRVVDKNGGSVDYNHVQRAQKDPILAMKNGRITMGEIVGWRVEIVYFNLETNRLQSAFTRVPYDSVGVYFMDDHGDTTDSITADGIAS